MLISIFMTFMKLYHLFYAWQRLVCMPDLMEASVIV